MHILSILFFLNCTLLLPLILDKAKNQSCNLSVQYRSVIWLGLWVLYTDTERWQTLSNLSGFVVYNKNELRFTLWVFLLDLDIQCDVASLKGVILLAQWILAIYKTSSHLLSREYNLSQHKTGLWKVKNSVKKQVKISASCYRIAYLALLRSLAVQTYSVWLHKKGGLTISFLYSCNICYWSLLQTGALI